MKRVLLTGMSGTGKSSIIDRLVAPGYSAVDLDGPRGSTSDETGDWIWREDRVRTLFDGESDDLLFVSGCATNQVVRFRADFDTIILLSAAREVIVARIATRTRNDYGKRPGELDEILYHVDSVEPRLRKVATHEVHGPPLDSVVATIIDIARAESHGADAQ
jgi:adenylate kinase family enzyme